MKTIVAKRRESCSSQFSSKSWLRQCNSILVKTSSSIDDLCKTVVNTKVYYQTDDISRELGYLALTVAVLERSVFSYAMKMRTGRSSDHISVSTSASQPVLPVQQFKSENDAVSSISETQMTPNSMASVVPVSREHSEKGFWKHPGTVISLLEMLTKSIQSLKSQLVSLRSEATLLLAIKRHWRFVVNGGMLFYLIYTLRDIRKLSVLKFFRIPSISSILFNCGSVYTVLLLSYMVLHRYRLMNLRASHQRLSTVIRFWQICMSEISEDVSKSHEATAFSDQGTFKDDDTSVSDQKSHIPIPISRWMLDLVGVSSVWHDQMYESDKDLWFLWYTYSILYSSVRLWFVIFNRSIPWYGFPVAWLSAGYYTLRPRLAATTMSSLVSSVYSPSVQSREARRHSWPDTWLKAFSALTNASSDKVKLSQIKEAFQFYDNLITTWKRKWAWLWSSVGLGLSKRIFFIRSHFTFLPLRWVCFYFVNVLGMGSPYPRLNSKTLNVPDDDLDALSLLKMITIVDQRDNVLCSSSSVVLYIHGDGWVANFLNSDLSFLSQWSNNCDVPIVLFDRTLKNANTSQYAALDEAFLLYKMITNNLLNLGSTPKNIIVSGDSIGARIAVALCMKIIDEHQKSSSCSLPIPSGLLLAYPPLNSSMMSTPSRAVFMMDPIVPMSLLNQNGEWSIPENPSSSASSELVVESSHPNAPFFSPLTAPLSILSEFPTTSLMVGSVDPFLDDSVDFAHRLSMCDVRCRLKVFQSLPHGFLGFQTIVPSAQEAVDLGTKWINSSLGKQ